MFYFYQMCNKLDKQIMSESNIFENSKNCHLQAFVLYYNYNTTVYKSLIYKSWYKTE